MQPKIAIIYLSFHCEPYIDDVVSSLKKLTYPHDRVEFVIVDNPHPEFGPSVKYIEENIFPLSGGEIPHVTLLAQKENFGFGSGNNVGARWALDNGFDYVTFSKNQKKEFDLGREGGHSHRRVLHAGDTTGNAIVEVLLDQVLKNAKIKVLEYHVGIDLILDSKTGHCHGIYALDTKTSQIHSYFSKILILASGGAGKIYLYTTNPDVATGDGIGMAYRAGAKLSNLEFVQFHPTSLYNPHGWTKLSSDSSQKIFLISEALRGEGGILKLISGAPFMQNYHPMKDLAPRDIVARAIDCEMKKSGDDYVLLDITHRDPDFIKKRFPHIYEV